jgi:hypothetical protein
MKHDLHPVISFLFILILSSCIGIVSDDRVEEDTLKKLKEKYEEDFSVLSVTNDTQGHGKGALWPTGNIFTIELNSKAESPTWFLAYAAYDSNKQFVYYGDTYKQRLVGDQMGKAFSRILREGYPDNIACNLYFDATDDSTQNEISLSSGSVYFFKEYPSHEKEMTEYLRKCLVKLQENKLSGVDLFIYYWSEDYLKEKPVDSFRFAFAYEYHEDYFETGKTPDRRYRLRLGKKELNHMDTLNLYRYMKDF